jgi:hypothetical protein
VTKPPGEPDFPRNVIRRAHHHPRKIRHKRRPCGGNAPNAPANLTFTWDIVEKHRHRRLNVDLGWDPVLLNTGGGRASIRRYIGQFQRSTDGGTTVSGRTRRFVVNESGIVDIVGASIVSGTIAEFTLARVHEFNPGDSVVVTGVTPGGYNGTWVVTSTPADNVFRADIGSSPGAGTAFGSVHESTTNFEIRGVRKHVWYRFRVRAENRDGCEGTWSSWTSWTLANDHVAPPSPLLVKIFSNATNRIVCDWDPPTVFLPLEGTATNSASSASVVGTGTFFQIQLGPGDVIKLGAETQTVLSITDNTHLTVQTAFTNAHTDVVPYIEETDPDVAFYDVWISTSVGFTPPAYKRDRYVHATKKAIKVADADEGSTFYARVRSHDASGNRSAWIPATIAGNSSSGTTPDGILIGKGGGGKIVVTFTKPGRLRVKHYPYKWINPTGSTLNFRKARATVGDREAGTGAPTGSAVKINLRRWQDPTLAANDPVFQVGGGGPDDDRLSIAAGAYRDTNGPSTFEITQLLNEEAISVKVAQVGSTFPGEDLQVQVVLEPA